MSRKANPEKMTAFGKIVIKRLNELKMTQKELANKLYITPVYLNRMLYGEHAVQLRTMSAIAMVLDIPMVKLQEAALNETKKED